MEFGDSVIPYDGWRMDGWGNNGWDGGIMGGRGGEFGPPSECEDAGSDVEKR